MIVTVIGIGSPYIQTTATPAMKTETLIGKESCEGNGVLVFLLFSTMCNRLGLQCILMLTVSAVTMYDRYADYYYCNFIYYLCLSVT